MAAYLGDVDSALIAKLLADAPLMALCPGGVYFGDTASGATPFVIVTYITGDSDDSFGATAYEAPLYLVKAVEYGKGSVVTKAAGARIDALLNGGTLTVPGYDLMIINRRKPDWYVRYTEDDPANPEEHWKHRGGFYEIWVSPT